MSTTYTLLKLCSARALLPNCRRVFRATLLHLLIRLGDSRSILGFLIFPPVEVARIGTDAGRKTGALARTVDSTGLPGSERPCASCPFMRRALCSMTSQVRAGHQLFLAMVSKSRGIAREGALLPIKDSRARGSAVGEQRRMAGATRKPPTQPGVIVLGPLSLAWIPTLNRDHVYSRCQTSSRPSGPRLRKPIHGAQHFGDGLFLAERLGKGSSVGQSPNLTCSKQ